MRTNTKLFQVLHHLKQNKTLTQRESVELFNDYRLSAKIHVLIHDYGYDITCEMLPFTDCNGNKSRYGKYTLHQNPYYRGQESPFTQALGDDEIKELEDE